MKTYSSLIVSGTFEIHFASQKQHVRGKIGRIDKNFNSTGYVLVDHLKGEIENSIFLLKTLIKDEPRRVLGASIDCMENLCSGFGLCAPKKIWSATSMTTLAGNLGLLWNGDQCFCFDGSSGENCS